MKKAVFETDNKKHARFTLSLRYSWLCCFRIVQLFVRACRVITRACQFGFNRNDYFFIQDTIDMLRLDISQHAPRLEEYNITRNQPSSCYHIVNVERYIWRGSWNKDIHLITRSTRPNEFELIIQPGEVVIAVGDTENI